MKFLVDRCAGRRLAEWLRAQGHDVVESRTLGPDPGDRALLEWSSRNRRILLTIDTDFGKLLFVDKVSPCAMVRLPDVPAGQRILLMQVILARYGDQLEAGAIITVRGNKIRISSPPK